MLLIFVFQAHTGCNWLNERKLSYFIIDDETKHKCFTAADPTITCTMHPMETVTNPTMTHSMETVTSPIMTSPTVIICNCRLFSNIVYNSRNYLFLYAIIPKVKEKKVITHNQKIKCMTLCMTLLYYNCKSWF